MVPPSGPPHDAPFTLGRLFRLWLPLAFTFLLMSGSSPIVTAGITRLPEAKLGLAAFLDAFRVAIFLHAPTFVVRDIAIRAIPGRPAYRRTLTFVMVVAAICSVLELVVALTPVGDWLLREVTRTPPELIARTKWAILPFALLPFLLALRGLHQGVHIRGETARWVGIGTALRMVAITVFAFLIAPPLGLEPAFMGSMAFVVALVVESAVSTITALRLSPVLRQSREDSVGGMRALAAFAIPLMTANLAGVLFQPLVSRVAGGAGDPETSKAALQILISWVWFFSSTLFAMQAMTIAHVSDTARLKVIVRFGIVVAAGFSAFFLATAFVPFVRDAVLVGALGVRDADVKAFVLATLPLTVVFPALVLVRAVTRGLIVRSGRTGWVVLTSLAGVATLLLIDRFELLGIHDNGTLPAAQAWILALLVEAGLSVLALLGIGFRRAFDEGRPPAAAATGGRAPPGPDMETPAS